VSTLVVDPWGAHSDAALPALRLALDPVVAGRVVAGVLAARGEVTPSLTRVAVWRHKPGRRCLIAYSFGRGDAPVRTVLGKVRAKGADARTYRLQGHLWRRGFGPWAGTGIEVPEPLGLTPELGAWWQRRVEGVDGAAAVWGGDGVAACRRFAEAIHALHGTVPLDDTRRHGPHDELAILEARLTALAAERSAWAVRLEAVLSGCRGIAATLGPRPDRLVHRDFYPDQVLAGADRNFLLDLDLCALGDPALDVGNFAAHLVEHAIRAWGEPRHADAPVGAFVDRYLELAGPEHRPAVEAYTTLALVRLVQIAWSKPERRPFTLPLLELCEERLVRRCWSWSIAGPATRVDALVDESFQDVSLEADDASAPASGETRAGGVVCSGLRPESTSSRSISSNRPNAPEQCRTIPTAATTRHAAARTRRDPTPAQDLPSEPPRTPRPTNGRASTTTDTADRRRQGQ